MFILVCKNNTLFPNLQEKWAEIIGCHVIGVLTL